MKRIASICGTTIMGAICLCIPVQSQKTSTPIQTKVAESTKTIPAVPTDLQAKYFKAQSRALQAQNSLQQAQKDMQGRAEDFQETVQQLVDFCKAGGADVQIDKNGDPACVAKAVSPKTETPKK